jgi:hypothetical protein
MPDRPSPANEFLATHARLLLDSHQRLTGRALIPAAATEFETARHLYHAPFVVLSHGMEADPLFNYANLTAQRLFEMDWDAMIGLPSRYSAEAPERGERERLLARVATQGYIDDYAGVRVSRTGRRFRIEAATVWNLTDAQGRPQGQAAAFGRWFSL